MKAVGEVGVPDDPESFPDLLFRTVADIVSALRRARDFYDPRTTSLLLISPRNRRSVDAEPFRSGFIGTIEERKELLHLLGLLDERARRLLLMWFVEARPVAHIARALDISRVHCYRAKNRAFDSMLADAKRRARARAGTLRTRTGPISVKLSHIPEKSGENRTLRVFDR